MDVRTAIEQRRSIRKYKDKPLSEEFISELIEAARLAPSGNNAQPWKFYVVTDAMTKKKLKDNKIFPQAFVYTAPVLMFCAADPDAYKQHVAGLDDENKERAIRDLSIASAFIVLRAQELGLGTCYVGWMKKEEAKKVLGIPERFVLPYAITVGYSDEKPTHHPRKKMNEILLKNN